MDWSHPGGKNLQLFMIKNIISQILTKAFSFKTVNISEFTVILISFIVFNTE